LMCGADVIMSVTDVRVIHVRCSIHSNSVNVNVNDDLYSA